MEVCTLDCSLLAMSDTNIISLGNCKARLRLKVHTHAPYQFTIYIEYASLGGDLTED